MRALTLLLTAALAAAGPALAAPPEPLLQSELAQGWVLGADGAPQVLLLVRSVLGARGEPGVPTEVRADYPAMARALGLEVRPLTVDDLGSGTVLTLTELVHTGRPEAVDRYARPEVRGALAPVVHLYLETQLAAVDDPAVTSLVRALEQAALAPPAEVAEARAAAD